MSEPDRFQPDHDWPYTRPWRTLGGVTVLLDPDTGRRIDVRDTETAVLDRCWAALDQWAKRHHDTVEADVATRLQQDIDMEGLHRTRRWVSQVETRVTVAA